MNRCISLVVLGIDIDLLGHGQQPYNVLMAVLDSILQRRPSMLSVLFVENHDESAIVALELLDYDAEALKESIFAALVHNVSTVRVAQ